MCGQYRYTSGGSKVMVQSRMWWSEGLWNGQNSPLHNTGSCTLSRMMSPATSNTVMGGNPIGIQPLSMVVVVTLVRR